MSAKVVDLAKERLKRQSPEERVKRDILDMCRYVYGGKRPEPPTVVTDPKTAYALGWRPTPYEAELLGWPDGKPPERA